MYHTNFYTRCYSVKDRSPAQIQTLPNPKKIITHFSSWFSITRYRYNSTKATVPANVFLFIETDSTCIMYCIIQQNMQFSSN